MPRMQLVFACLRSPRQKGCLIALKDQFLSLVFGTFELPTQHPLITDTEFAPYCVLWPRKTWVRWIGFSFTISASWIHSISFPHNF